MKLSEIILDKLNETWLFEMAYSRKNAWIIVSNISQTLIKHIIKILIMPRSIDRQHWISEIANYLFDMSQIRLKPNNKRLRSDTYREWLLDEPDPDITEYVKFIKQQYPNEYFDIPDTIDLDVKNL